MAVLTLRTDPPLIAFTVGLCLIGFYYGAGLWLIGEYETDEPVPLAMFVLCSLLLALATVGREAFVPHDPDWAAPARLTGWASVATVALLTVFRMLRDLYRGIRTGDRIPPRGGLKVGQQPTPPADPARLTQPVLTTSALTDDADLD